jgi:hypothetical protein
MPAYVRYAKRTGQAAYIGKGQNIWGNVRYHYCAYLYSTKLTLFRVPGARQRPLRIIPHPDESRPHRPGKHCSHSRLPRVVQPHLRRTGAAHVETHRLAHRRSTGRTGRYPAHRRGKYPGGVRGYVHVRRELVYGGEREGEGAWMEAGPAGLGGGCQARVAQVDEHQIRQL